MRRVAGEALIGASRDEVWHLLDDLEGMPRWLPGIQAVSASGPAHLGTLYQTHTAILGMVRARDWEIVEYRPLTRQVRAARDGSLERRLVLTLDARGSGTRLHAELQFRSSLVAPFGALQELLGLASSARGPAGLVGAVKEAFEGRPR